MVSFVNKLISMIKPGDSSQGEQAPKGEYEQIFNLAKKKTLTPEKKRELETLYAQLFSKSDNAASGQLQFLGLDKIKAKMGEKWPRLQAIVYKTAEEVINQNISKHDIHFLYKDDRYVIIFTQSTMEEINQKVSFISEEISRRFLLLEEEELHQIAIRKEVKKIDAATFLDSELPDMMDYLYKQYNPGAVKKEAGFASDAESAPPKKEQILAFAPIHFLDTAKNTPAGRFCLARDENDAGDAIVAYKTLFRGRALGEKTALDIQLLQRATTMLQGEAAQAESPLVICPVQHETVYNSSSYDEYKLALQKVPGPLRRLLILLVTNAENQSLPVKDTYWFISFLKDLGFNVFVDIPMKETPNFQFLKNSGLDGAAIRLLSIRDTEAGNMTLLRDFHDKAAALKIKKTLAFDVVSPSMVDELKMIGFDYLCGAAVS